MLELGDVRLRYETIGEGPPVLLLAPGGLRGSRIEAWAAHAPWNPMDALAARHQVIAMDQRNTGTSFAPVRAGDGWPSYAADQLAVLDHLGVERCSLLGMCIGGAFIMELLATAPERFSAAVALQPIGLSSPPPGNRPDFRAIFEEWRRGHEGDHPEATDADWEGVWENLFGGDDALWSVPDSFLPTIETPLLVLQGDDTYHPRSASRLLADTVPSATLIERWKEPADQPAARTAVEDFLAEHAA
jgi:pimeloyl-ACP methyl ester carboxylesterase